jgi:hypothetical protein
MYIVGAATGTSEPTLMGTVILWLTDDKGVKHTFTLTHVNYMPKSPVNLLSTRVLSEQFTNEHGFDQQGTGISSVLDQASGVNTFNCPPPLIENYLRL